MDIQTIRKGLAHHKEAKAEWDKYSERISSGGINSLSRDEQWKARAANDTMLSYPSWDWIEFLIQELDKRE